jgi:endogenous inhibitor of DNA gyrase (YacG/DUF329 family)
VNLGTSSNSSLIVNTLYFDCKLLGTFKIYQRSQTVTVTMKQHIVNCPQCGKSVAWNQNNRFRPFCSERCKTIDLAQWAQESYRIPESEQQKEESEPQATDR